ncbi:hypothetical protein Rhopal_000517-T1 [Rhodotorula paludigena]|uniref:FCP1 homology domain-containing protein n=1 Tax=Rhodotorula paludigena TaxID=86838 RepID=A0AAV5GG37_9BASI|nr:hypothetical protein Rhopal_000517-T1 [Rhodotorula paludigena]
MATPIVFASQLPSGLAPSRNHTLGNSSSEDESAVLAQALAQALPKGLPSGLHLPPGELAGLQAMLGTALASAVHQSSTCRPSHVRDSLPSKAPASCYTLHCPCSEQNRQRDRYTGRTIPHRFKPVQPVGPPAIPSSSYLQRASVPSRPGPPSQPPLLVLSLESVLAARLPYHLSGGYTSYLARPYLKTLMDYLLQPHGDSPWRVVFFTHMKRAVALEALKELDLPVGGPERDERDGVMGLFARDDMRDGWDGGPIEVKDLDVLWDELEHEEGVRWGPEDTVVLTNYLGHMKLQPFNYILVPEQRYHSSQDDQFLLIMIGVLQELEHQTNFADFIRHSDWNEIAIWTHDDPVHLRRRNEYLLEASRVTITAFTGNEHIA